MNDAGATLQQLVVQLRRHGGRKAVGVQGEIGVRWWSYDELARAALAAAALLERRGLQKGDRVIVWGKNSPEWVAWFLGAIWRGVVVVPVDDEHSESYMRSIVEATKARLVIHDAHHEAPDGVDTQALEEVRPTIDLASHTPLRQPVMPNDAAAIMFTSGTVSNPRGVVLTHENILSQLGRFQKWQHLLRLTPIRMLGIAPLSHVQGLVGDVCIPLCLGLTVLYVPGLNAAHLIRTIRTYKITLLVTVPRVVRVLTQAIQALPSDVPGKSIGERAASIRSRAYRRHVMFNELNRVLGLRFWVIVVGGATFSVEDEIFWRSTGRFVVQGYGLTETTAIVTMARPFLRPLGSIGRMPRDGSMRINPDGELLIRGGAVASAFVDAQTTAPLLRDGYLHTGDIVRTDARGELFFVGRSADIIVTAEGFNVFPHEVEAVLQRQAGVKEAAVCSRTQNDQEQVHAVLILQPGFEADPVVRAANAELERHQNIRSWSLWHGSELPRGALHKVRRHEVAASIQQRAGDSEADPAPADAAPERPVERAFALVTKGAVPDDGNLALVDDLGLSSLDLVELLTRIEKERGVALDHVNIRADWTVADVQSAVGTASATARPAQCAYAADWRQNVVGRAIQFLVRLVLIGCWFRSFHRVVCTGAESLSRLEPPLVIAVAPHRHWLDVFAVYCVLPRHLRSRVLTITNFEFERTPSEAKSASLLRRCWLAIARLSLVPAIFPFVIVPPFGRTREGLFETARMMDRGYVPITFPKGFHFGDVDAKRHDPGTTRLALEFGASIVPIWINGNDRFNGRRWYERVELEVLVGEAVSAPRTRRFDDFVRDVEQRFEELSQGRAEPPVAVASRHGAESTHCSVHSGGCETP